MVAYYSSHPPQNTDDFIFTGTELKKKKKDIRMQTFSTILENSYVSWNELKNEVTLFSRSCGERVCLWGG